MARTALCLRHSVTCALADLDGGGGGRTGGVTLAELFYVCCRGGLTADSVSRSAASRPIMEKVSARLLWGDFLPRARAPSVMTGGPATQHPRYKIPVSLAISGCQCFVKRLCAEIKRALLWSRSAPSRDASSDMNITAPNSAQP